jgi:hypothetical protein
MFESVDNSSKSSHSTGTSNEKSRKRPSGEEFSILAFVFMPQFKYSLQGAAHLYPVFMQMLAVMFVAAELLPRNHPATRYGAKNVEDYTVGELMGEAWYNLNRQRGTNMRSWGMFTSIVLMCFAFIGTMGALLTGIFFGLGQTAQAQIFTLQSNYLGSGPNVLGTTDLTAVAVPPPPTATGGALGQMFDKRFNTAQGLQYDDWGLILLDKIVRSAADGVGNGGQLQNALGHILYVFNLAMTVVAAVMLFWIIVSVTVDTAKTGIAGGGRHNMVWGPVRIIFALGLMIPLGGIAGTGFSSGQYCVMKLAEWGSNLGTNAWTVYVNAVTNGGANSSGGLIAGVVPGGSASLVNDIAMMKVCQVAYNDYVYQATGPGVPGSPPPSPGTGQSDPAQLVGAMNTWSGDGTKLTHALTNASQKALCGALIIAVPAGDGPADPAGTIGAGWGTGAVDSFTGYWTGAAVAMMGTVPPRPTAATASAFNYGTSIIEDGALSIVASTYAATTPSYIAEGQDTCTKCFNPIAFATNTPVGGFIYQEAMAGARAQVAAQWIQQIPTVECGACSDGPTTGTSMNDFACSFVAHHAPGGIDGNAGSGSGTNSAQDAAITYTAASNIYTNTTGGLLCPQVADGTATACGAQPVSLPPNLPLPTDDPTYQCHMAGITAFQNAINPMFGGTDGVTGSVVKALNNWLSSAVSTDMARYGWASAGVFYTKVASVNVAAQNMTQPAITFMPGVLSTVEATCDVELGTTDCAPSGIGYRVAQIMQAYSSWYDINTTTGRGVASLGTNAVAALNGSSAAGGNGAEFGADKPGSNGSMSVLSLLHGGKTALNNAIAQQLGIPEGRKPFLISLIGSVSDNTLPLANLSALGAKLVLFGSMMMLATAIVQGTLGGINFGVSTTALGLSCMFTMLFSLCQVIIASGITLAFYVPLMPFIRSAFAVMTWMVSVFEAVVMIPIAALAHLTTEGDGLAAGAKQCWVLWLNVLTRPILFVIGFIGAFIVYDAWVVYFTTAFAAAAGNASDQDNIIMKVLGYCCNSVFYVSTCYAAANSVFKMVDLIPSALMRWMPNGQMDTSFDDGAQAAGGYASQIGGQAASSMQSGASSIQGNISRGFSQAGSGGRGERPGVGAG